MRILSEVNHVNSKLDSNINKCYCLCSNYFNTFQYFMVHKYFFQFGSKRYLAHLVMLFQGNFADYLAFHRMVFRPHFEKRYLKI